MSCRSSKTVTQQTHNEAVHDTVIETVTLTIHDTLRETTTITIQTNATGDTTRLTTTRDRERITNQNRTANHTHHTTQTERDSTTKETTTTPIQPINPKFPIKPIVIAFILISQGCRVACGVHHYNSDNYKHNNKEQEGHIYTESYRKQFQPVLYSLCLLGTVYFCDIVFFS